MTAKNENDFVDWLYNRYVEALRNKDFLQMSIYFDVLDRCVSMAFSQRKFSSLRTRAKKRLKEIATAGKNGTLCKLDFVGEEFVREFEKAMQDYEQTLKDQGFSQQLIRDLVIEKRCNYGND